MPSGATGSGVRSPTRSREAEVNRGCSTEARLRKRALTL